MFDFSQFFAAVAEEHARGMAEAAAAVEEFTAIAVVGEAQELCPVESGALMASGTWSDPVVSGTQVSIEAGFNVDYAAARHERPPEEDAPPKINPKGVNKFLERAMREATPKFVPFMRERLGGES